MNKIFMKELNEHIGNEIELDAFVENIRDLQYVQFVILKDGTGKVQMTIEKSDENNKELIEIISNLTNESTVKVRGKLIENEKVKLRGMELIPTSIEVTSTAEGELPIDIKNKDAANRETRLDYRFLDLRREDNNLLFRIGTLLEHKLREFCIMNDFIEIHSPKISAQAAESGAEVFKLDYFGKEACLSQSPQFYKQMAQASCFDKVFEIGPAYRAENSHTSYHATEINMADVEFSWIEGVEDVMDFEENWLKYALKAVKEKFGEDIKSYFNTEIGDLEKSWPRIDFKEAKRILKEEFNFNGEREIDFERQEEKLLCEWALKNHGVEFIFVTEFPYEARPFYHMLNEDGSTKSYDLLYKGLEITTGAQREHRYDILIEQIKGKGINPKELEFYTDFFKYGCPPHGGYGVGVARILMQLLEIDNIREATFIYRGPTRLNP